MNLYLGSNCSYHAKGVEETSGICIWGVIAHITQKAWKRRHEFVFGEYLLISRKRRGRDVMNLYLGSNCSYHAKGVEETS